jgi:glutamate/aspartate transport system permease protein
MTAAHWFAGKFLAFKAWLLGWDLGVFCRSTVEEVRYPGCFGPPDDATFLQALFEAWGWTLKVSVLSLLLAVLVGVLVGVARTLPGRAPRLAGEAWTELFRNIPLLVQIFLWFHVVSRLPGLQSVPALALVVCALGFFTSARVSEQVKAAIETVPTGQRHAGLALGLTLPQTYRHVLLPVALRVIIPPLTSELMNVIKNSSVAYAVSIAELTLFATNASDATNKAGEMYLAATVLYCVSALAVNGLSVLFEKWVRVPGVAGAGAGR